MEGKQGFAYGTHGPQPDSNLFHRLEQKHACIGHLWTSGEVEALLNAAMFDETCTSVQRCPMWLVACDLQARTRAQNL